MSELPKIQDLLKDPEKMRVMCAEACGIPKHARFYAQDHGGKRWWQYRSRKEAEQSFKHFGEAEHQIEEIWIPGWLEKYDTSLDAMAEARNTLTEKEGETYAIALWNSAADKPPRAGNSLFHCIDTDPIDHLAAFLIAKGLAQP